MGLEGLPRLHHLAVHHLNQVRETAIFVLACSSLLQNLGTEENRRQVAARLFQKVSFHPLKIYSELRPHHQSTKLPLYCFFTHSHILRSSSSDREDDHHPASSSPPKGASEQVESSEVAQSMQGLFGDTAELSSS